ncbi:MAG TPA: NACHT domain-containing protein [Allosphingosinicella sp.]
MKKRWQKFEEQVREIASLIHAKPCKPGKVAGTDIDGIIDLDPTTKLLIEITTNVTPDKVRGDLVRLENARNALYRDGIFARGVVVLDREPTTDMADGGRAVHIDVISVNQLAAQFIYYDRYRSTRLLSPFGSAVDPQTGVKDNIAYVPVTYVDKRTGTQYTPAQIADRLLDGSNVVLLGEYGSGKSRCVSELFETISTAWGDTFQFPIAVNLRECWGLERADEIIRRHFGKLGLDDMEASAVRAFNRKNVLFLLDGFDEIGTQSWSTDDARLRQLRAQALVAVKDAVLHSGTGTLITGRDHYFSSDTEMYASLGLEPKSTLVVHVRDEFSLDEMFAYFRASDIDVTLPEWLPRRPLICQTIAQLSETERDEMFGVGSSEASFWNYFIVVICKRDARINTSFDENTIYEVFLKLSEITRNKPSNVGPINQRELQEAFESVVGKLPVEDAAVMLQRLPSLGRVGPDSGDRQFIDTYILDGLRAHHIVRLVDGDESERREAATTPWENPLQVLGQKVLASKAQSKMGAFLTLAKRAGGGKNGTLAGDILAGLIRVGQNRTDLDGLKVSGAWISELDLSVSDVENLEISDSIIDEVILPTAPPKRTTVQSCLIGKVTGASSIDGVGDWIKQNEISEFDSVRTLRRIRDVGLSPGHEVLVAIIKKTFFQPGSGRKEEALLRGFAAGAFNKVAPKVLNLLVTNGILTHFRGDEGRVYAPNRAAAGRMKLMLDELRASNDAIWAEVESL